MILKQYFPTESLLLEGIGLHVYFLGVIIFVCFCKNIYLLGGWRSKLTV